MKTSLQIDRLRDYDALNIAPTQLFQGGNFLPNRILRDGINNSRAVNSLNDSAEIFYRRLMSLVDDFGCLEADVDLIRAHCFALKLEEWSVERVRQALSDVSTTPSSDGHMLVNLYRAVEGDKIYLEISNFRQRTRSERKYPNPVDGHLAVMCPTDDGHDLGKSLIPLNDGPMTVTCQTPARLARATSPSPSTPVLDLEPFNGNQSLVRARDLEVPVRVSFNQFWIRWCELTRRKLHETLARQAWISVVEIAMEAAAMDCLERYGLSGEVQCGKVTNPDKWIYDQARDNFAGEWQPRQSRQLSQQEEVLARAIARTNEEGNY